METWTYVSKHYSINTCKTLVTWIRNNANHETECGILKSATMKSRVVMITSDLNDISKFKDYLKTITLV